MQPFRLPPALPAHAMKTYQILAPPATHHREATCDEVDCAAARHGWTTTVDVGTELGARQANYIRLHSGRHFTATETGTLVTFSFPAGQRCFATHRVRLDRPELFLVRGGDWRGDPRGEGVRQHTRPEFWVEDFAEHQEHLADRIEKG